MAKLDADIVLVKGSGGVFEVTAGEKLLFSKKALGRFPEDDEIDAIADQLAAAD